ncbi:MAG: acetyltransferase [Fodinibius sp.]|nr:acetyltransferase [Fodinibius sp.]
MAKTNLLKKDNMALAESIRAACIDVAREGFRDASMSGLCSEGAMEAAVSAMQSLKLEQVIKDG